MERKRIRPEVLFEAHSWPGWVNAGPSAGPLTAEVLAAGPRRHGQPAVPAPSHQKETQDRPQTRPDLLPGAQGEARGEQPPHRRR